MCTVRTIHYDRARIEDYDREQHAIASVGQCDQALRLAGRDNLVIGRKAAGLFFGKFQSPIDSDLEHAADTRH